MTRYVFAMLLVAVSALDALAAPKINYIQARPLVDVVRTRLQPVGSLTYAPAITWGGDVHSQLAVQEGIFKKNGLDIKLIREDNFAEQVQACLDGKTPFVRGTIGMINAANEAFVKSGTELVVVYQHTWSVGGDTLVTRNGITQIADLRGKTIAVQLYGPHMDYVAKLLQDSGIRPSEVNFKWLAELYPTEDSDPNLIDNPPMAFVADESVDAAPMIIPDALGAAEGDEGSLVPQVPGATILTTTKTNSRVIADVYAVRKDWFDANRAKVDAFVKSLLEAEEELRDLRKRGPKKDLAPGESDPYTDLFKSSAQLLLDSAEATDIIDALLADCEHVGYGGNVGFITGTLPNGNITTRNLQSMSEEIQSSFVSMGLIKRRSLLATPELDYAALAQGLRYADKVVSGPRFDRAATERLVAGELSSLDDIGSLFTREITFGPNQSDFPIDEYSDKFQELIELAQTNRNALVIIEGHADPLGLLYAKWKGASASSMSAKRADVKTISLERARKVRIAFLNYCADNRLDVNESQFVANGRGVAAPKHEMPQTLSAFKQLRREDPQGLTKKWNENRRVVFRIQQVEAELDDIMSIE